LQKNGIEQNGREAKASLLSCDKTGGPLLLEVRAKLEKGKPQRKTRNWEAPEAKPENGTNLENWTQRLRGKSGSSERQGLRGKISEGRSQMEGLEARPLV
jgi:hypothetical protein